MVRPILALDRLLFLEREGKVGDRWGRQATELETMDYHIITSGKLLFERTPYKVMIEPRIYNEYFDFRIILSRYGLTRSRPI